jgi:hypothetical protein
MADTMTAECTVADLAAEILARHERLSLDEQRITPQYVPRASNLGDCDRELLYQLTHWQHRPPFDPYLQQLFERGHWIERHVRDRLNRMGIDVIGAQQTCEVKDRDGTLLATAHIDGKVSWHGIEPVLEVKGLNQFSWNGLDSIESFKASPLGRKYRRQILTYMYATNEPFGLILIDDKSGHWKLIPVHLEDHLAECELILARLRRVIDAKKNGAEIGFIDNPALCKRCWAHLAGICQPPMDFSKGGVHLIDDPELEELFGVIERTQSQGKAYESSVADVKEHFRARGQGEYMVGEWLVTTRQLKNGIRTTWQKIDEPEEV